MSYLWSVLWVSVRVMVRISLTSEIYLLVCLPQSPHVYAGSLPVDINIKIKIKIKDQHAYAGSLLPPPCQPRSKHALTSLHRPNPNPNPDPNPKPNPKPNPNPNPSINASSSTTTPSSSINASSIFRIEEARVERGVCDC